MAPVFKDGRKAVLKIVHAGSTMILSSGMDDSEFARSVETYDVSVYKDDDKNYVAGMRSATLKGGGPYASTYESFISGMLGSTANPAFTYSPVSTATGNPKKTGSFIVTDYSIKVPAQGRIEWSMDTVVTGAVTSTRW